MTRPKSFKILRPNQVCDSLRAQLRATQEASQGLLHGLPRSAAERADERECELDCLAVELVVRQLIAGSYFRPNSRRNATQQLYVDVLTFCSIFYGDGAYAWLAYGLHLRAPETATAFRTIGCPKVSDLILRAAEVRADAEYERLRRRRGHKRCQLESINDWEDLHLSEIGEELLALAPNPLRLLGRFIRSAVIGSEGDIVTPHVELSAPPTLVEATTALVRR